jgi:hypothetical protein
MLSAEFLFRITAGKLFISRSLGSLKLIHSRTMDLRLNLWSLTRCRWIRFIICRDLVLRKDKKPVSVEELMLANAFSISAIMNALEKKGLVSREEVVAEVDRLKREMDKQAKKN